MDDHDLFLKQCLPVPSSPENNQASLDSDFSALSYLNSVRLEANSFPKVLLPKDTSLIDSVSSNKTNNSTSLLSSLPQDLLHTSKEFKNKNNFDPKWADDFNSTFSQWNESFQDYLSLLDADFFHVNNELFWKKLLFDDDPASGGAAGNTSPSKELSMKLLAGLNRKSILRIIEWFTNWLRCDSLTYKQSFSIFVLLLTLDTLLSNQEIYVLRSLSRKLIEIRSNSISPNIPSSVYTNILISTISTTFGQKDLV
ncbi:hypothetical protein BB560_000513 [Smittium megazygosporum]|uniref:Uncharacterized protein n=1 Tax=Smittium megazygosporum TaxID=133381 RepID=A0A2T9ZKB7_9FUNG|nr:hypothetical protein BB560_000513 [Smittium megazygosporum]